MVNFDFDTEGFLIAPGCQAPPLVCVQWCEDDSPADIIHARDPACYRYVRARLEDSSIWSGHNLAHDTISIMASFPDLLIPMFDAYDADRMLDTIVIAKLIDIATGRFKWASTRGYGLDVCAKACGIELDKSDPWRMKYGTLWNVPVAEWPVEARSYALKDAEAQRAVRRGLMDIAVRKQVPLVDVFRQTRAALWLRLCTTWGIAVDKNRAEKYIADVQETLDEDREICVAEGLVRPDGSKDTKLAKARMVRLCEETGDEPILTDSGDIALNEDAVILHGDEVLESYQRYATGTAQLSRAQKLYLAGKYGKPIQARIVELQDTGRPACREGEGKKKTSISAFGSQLFNPAKDKKVKRKDGSIYVRKGPREIFVPRKGTAFVSTDWEGAEACGVAQVCIWTPGIGFSRLAERINAGANLPTEFGAIIQGISSDEAYALRKAGGEGKSKFDAGPRQAAKIALYGYFANMSPAKLALSARKQYRVNMSEAQATEYKEKLKIFAPELPLYWKWGQTQLDTPIPGQDKWGRPRKVCSRFTQFWSGRVRGGCSYTELENTPFQGLVADLFKLSGWRLAVEMYTGRYWDRRPGTSPLFGCRVVNCPYDDFLTEVPLDRIHEAGYRQAEVMQETTREVCPDVVYRVSPAAMLRWYKDAEGVHDENGKLIIWEPKND